MPKSNDPEASESEGSANFRLDAPITEQHREYLVRRHGTADLDPLPSMSDADPLNWPRWRKVVAISLVAFHAMMALFTASCIQSAFVEIAEDLGKSIQATSYLVSIIIAVLGAAPLLWRPLSHTYGRRPVFLLTLLGSLVGNVGCAVSHSYGTMGLCRAITAFFIAPGIAIGTAVVRETFFRHERARYMGIWTAMLTLGVPIAPLICGFVAMRVSYRWIYWILAMTNAAQFILHAILGSETRFEPSTCSESPSKGTKYLGMFRRIDPAPLTLSTFLHPLTLVAYPAVTLPAVAYSMVFLWGGVMITFEIPQIFPEQFGFNAQQVGLQYIGVIIGTILGEQVGGISSDKWMLARQRRLQDSSHVAPEYRLWLSYAGYALTICGVAVFLVQIDRAGETWNVTPIVGAAIAAAGNQIVTTVLITYAVDCHSDQAASIGVYVTLVRQCWGFIGPFWIPQLLESAGLRISVVVVTVMIVAASIVPTVLLQWRGAHWRTKGRHVE